MPETGAGTESGGCCPVCLRAAAGTGVTHVTVDLSNNATEGTFRLAIGAHITGALNYDVSAADLQALIRAFGYASATVVAGPAGAAQPGTAQPAAGRAGADRTSPDTADKYMDQHFVRGEAT